MDAKRFLEIENEYNLYNIEIDGVKVWRYCRFDIWNYNICADSLNMRRKPGSKQSLSDYLARLRFLTVGLRVLRNADVLFICHERRMKIGDYYDCIYTDKVKDCFPNSVSLEVPFSNSHFRPIRTKNMIYVDRNVVCQRIRKKIVMKFRPAYVQKLRTIIKTAFFPALDEMKKAFLWNYDEETITKKLLGKVLMVKYQKKYYARILKRIKPRIIVEVVSYSTNRMIINEIAKTMNIPVIELQHGTIYEEHMAYQYMLPVQIEQFPDYLFLFSDFWKNRMNVPIPEKALISTGFPFFEDRVKEYKEIERKDDRYTFLFVSQNTIGQYLAELAIELDHRIDHHKYKILYKLHPEEYTGWKEKYTHFSNSGIEVIDSNEKNIYDCFALSDAQIGVYSTAIYEGLGFGLKTMILRVGHYDAMLPLIKAGYAEVVENEIDVLRAVEKKDQAVSTATFWKSDALNNIVCEMKKIAPDIKVNGFIASGQ